MKLRARAKIEEVVAEELARRVARGDFRAGLVGLQLHFAETLSSDTRSIYIILVFVMLTKAYTNISIHELRTNLHLEIERSRIILQGFMNC